jgi:hypothetical protein
MDEDEGNIIEVLAESLLGEKASELVEKTPDPSTRPVTRLSASNLAQLKTQECRIGSWACNCVKEIGKVDKSTYFTSLTFTNPANVSQEVSLSVGQVFFTWQHGKYPLVCLSIQVKSKYVPHKGDGRKIQVRHILARNIGNGTFVRTNQSLNSLAQKPSSEDGVAEVLHTDVAEIVHSPDGIVLGGLEEAKDIYEVALAESKAARARKDAERYKVGFIHATTRSILTNAIQALPPKGKALGKPHIPASKTTLAITGQKKRKEISYDSEEEPSLKPIRATSSPGPNHSQIVSVDLKPSQALQLQEDRDKGLMETLISAFNTQRTAHDEQVKMFIGALIQTKERDTALELQRLKTQEAQAQMQREAIASFNTTSGLQRASQRSSASYRSSRSPSPKRSRHF